MLLSRRSPHVIKGCLLSPTVKEVSSCNDMRSPILKGFSWDNERRSPTARMSLDIMKGGFLWQRRSPYGVFLFKHLVFHAYMVTHWLVAVEPRQRVFAVRGRLSLWLLQSLWLSSFGCSCMRLLGLCSSINRAPPEAQSWNWWRVVLHKNE